MSNFNAFLDSNPKLKMSSSAYLKDLYETEILPRATQSLSFLDNAPYVSDVRSFFNRPAAVISKDISDATLEQLKTTAGDLTWIGTRVVSRLGDGVIGLAGIATNIAKDSIDALSSLANEAAETGPQFSFPTFTLPPLTPSGLPVKILTTAELREYAASFTDISGKAISRAGATFSAELAVQGNKLVSNTAYFADVLSAGTIDALRNSPKQLSETLPEVVSKVSAVKDSAKELAAAATTSLPQKLQQLNGVIGDNVQNVRATILQASNDLAIQAQATGAVVQEKLRIAQQEAPKWRLFPEGGNFEESYIGQQLKALGEYAERYRTSPGTRTAVDSGRVSQTVEQLIAQQREALSQAFERLSSTLKAAQYQPTAISQQSQVLSFSSRSIINAQKDYDQLLSELVKLQSTLSKLQLDSDSNSLALDAAKEKYNILVDQLMKVQGQLKNIDIDSQLKQPFNDLKSLL